MHAYIYIRKYLSEAGKKRSVTRKKTHTFLANLFWLVEMEDPLPPQRRDTCEDVERGEAPAGGETGSLRQD